MPAGAFIALMLVLFSVNGSSDPLTRTGDPAIQPMPKIRFDPSVVNDDGLYFIERIEQSFAE